MNDVDHLNGQGPKVEGEEVELSENGKLMVAIDDAARETLESTRRMVQLCEEGKEAGIRTLVMLDEQGEQLDCIDEGMDQINQDMRDAEKNLEGMEKCCGLCILPWKKVKNFEKGSEYSKAWKSNEDGQANTDGPRVIVDSGPGGPQGGFVNRITNDAREDEMEQNLVDVSSMVGNLRNMAVDMGNEITSQNKQLDRINQKATSNEVRIMEANKRANKILKEN